MRVRLIGHWLERLKLWVRSGGRCQICLRSLLEGQLAYKELTFGQAAHIVGQKATARSPRGLDENLTDEQRDNADNLMLICDDEHSEIDKWGSRDAFTVPFLRELKRKHEDRVSLATSFGEYNRTTPIRMVGWLRGSPVEVGRDAVATAVMASAARMPRFDLSTRNMLEIDLRGLPGEEGPSPEYYAAACQAIDRVVKAKVAEAVASEDIIHLSVFALARLPLLVYLGFNWATMSRSTFIRSTGVRRTGSGLIRTRQPHLSSACRTPNLLAARQLW